MTLQNVASCALIFERLQDDRKNWILADPSDKSPSKLRISTLSVDHGRLRYLDHGEPFELDVRGSMSGTTRLEVEGTIADAANISAIDARLRIQGQTLAKLYPFLARSECQ